MNDIKVKSHKMEEHFPYVVPFLYFKYDHSRSA
jgi:hypothetical protein